jgi:hypothetical protein
VEWKGKRSSDLGLVSYGVLLYELDTRSDWSFESKATNKPNSRYRQALTIGNYLWFERLKFFIKSSISSLV